MKEGCNQKNPTSFLKKWWFWAAICLCGVFGSCVFLEASGIYNEMDDAENLPYQEGKEQDTGSELEEQEPDPPVVDDSTSDETLEGTESNATQVEPYPIQNNEPKENPVPQSGTSTNDNYTPATVAPVVQPEATEKPNLPLKATCKDGSVQYQDDPAGPNYRGMCSGHGGIAQKHGRVP